MCHPTMFALVTGPQVDLAWLEAFTSAIYQCAADGLKERDKRKYMVSCIALQEIQSLTVMLFTPMVAFFFSNPSVPADSFLRMESKVISKSFQIMFVKLKTFHVKLADRLSCLSSWTKEDQW